MKVVITGANGFLGNLLTAALVARGSLAGPNGANESIDAITLADASLPSDISQHDGNVSVATGDITDEAFVRSLIDRPDCSVFHLASMVSAGSELDFDRAHAVNLSGTRSLLEACRAQGGSVRFVFTSSIVAYGALEEAVVASDTTRLTPETTYGTTKAMSELLVNDYTRKGFVDGRSARLPTVIIRPGQPNAAASSWVSGIFREPLNGIPCVVPVPLSTHLPVSGYRTIVENLVRFHDVRGELIGHDRAINFPAIDPSVKEMLDGLRQASDRDLGTIEIEPQQDVVDFFRGWASHSSFDRATSLGLGRDASIESIVRAYIEDFLA